MLLVRVGRLGSQGIQDSCRLVESPFGSKPSGTLRADELECGIAVSLSTRGGGRFRVTRTGTVARRNNGSIACNMMGSK
jgi:hypothetical protein